METVSARKDDVQYHEVEFLRADQEEALFSHACNDNVVLLAPQALLEGTGNFCFLFNDDGAAQARHGQAEAVKRFESVYSPELVRGEVVLTDYELISGKPTPEQSAYRQNLFNSSAAAPFFKVRCMRS